MVFGWLYSRVIDGIKPHLFAAMDEYLSSKEFGDYSIAYFDGLYERYKQKTMGMIGGYEKNLNLVGEAAQQPISFPIQQMPNFDAKTLLYNALMTALTQNKDNPKQNRQSGGRMT